MQLVARMEEHTIDLAKLKQLHHLSAAFAVLTLTCGDIYSRIPPSLDVMSAALVKLTGVRMSGMGLSPRWVPRRCPTGDYGPEFKGVYRIKTAFEHELDLEDDALDGTINPEHMPSWL
jgi:hypothetical protein